MSNGNASMQCVNVEHGLLPTAISQAQLRDYLTLVEFAAEKNEYRLWLIGQLEAGAEIELGPLTAVIKVQYQKRFSREKLEILLDPDLVANLHDRLDSTEVKSLRVTEQTSRVVSPQP